MYLKGQGRTGHSSQQVPHTAEDSRSMCLLQFHQTQESVTPEDLMGLFLFLPVGKATTVAISIVSSVSRDKIHSSMIN
jgi:hypothetical protein